jgi:hexosaminidase
VLTLDVLEKLMRRTAAFLIVLAVAWAFVPALAQSDEKLMPTALGLVPMPRAVSAYASTYTMPAQVSIAASSADERNVAELAREYLRSQGIQGAIVSAAAATSAQLRFVTVRDVSLGREGYRLHVGAAGAIVTAASGAGLFYGLQTFEQLFAPDGGNAVHYVDISDAPAYGYRGIHLDVGRHFFPVSFIEKYIDLAARYKLNTFHWHLTEDQGWRIEIKRYPRLTEVASCRSGTMIGLATSDNPVAETDGVRYCGYYTQSQIREVVAYAKKRYVTVVPEIEMPGHSVEVLAAYPQLACRPGSYEVRTTWGVSEDIVCPSEATIAFYKNVLSEVMELFPGPYIHTGGDEAPKTVWKKSPLVQSIMRKHHLRDENEVQGWFDTRIEAFIRAHGRRMIGWDEILGGDISRSAIVMSWRGVSGGVVAASRGNDVIMTPDSSLYFDHSQGNPYIEPLNIGGTLTLHDVYDYDPVIDALPAAQRRHVLGAQANLWTEYIATPQRVEYMLLPRLLALSEITWTPADLKDWDSFVMRTGNHYARLESEGVQFRIPDPAGLADTVTSKSSVTLALHSPVPGAKLFYTTDGSIPTTASTPYAAPFTLNLQPGQAVLVRAVTVLRDGRTSQPAQALFQRVAEPGT